MQFTKNGPAINTIPGLIGASISVSVVCLVGGAIASRCGVFETAVYTWLTLCAVNGAISYFEFCAGRKRLGTITTVLTAPIAVVYFTVKMFLVPAVDLANAVGNSLEGNPPHGRDAD